MAERVRTWTRSHMDALACVHSWKTGVMLPIPAEIAAIFPPREGHTPHITLVHVEWSSPEQTTQIMQIVAEELEGLLGEEVRLGELGYFERFEDRVAYLAGEVTPKLRAARERMAKKISDLDIEVSRLGEEWIPHATLDVTEPGQDFVGSLPTGAWAIDDVQVWHGGEQRSVEAVRADGLEQELERTLSEYGEQDWFVHNTLAHPLMELLTEQGFVNEAGALHGLTLPEDQAALSDPAAFAAWLASAITRTDAADLDEDKIKAWLVEHISGARKMSRPRMLRLAEAAGSFAYLKPPKAATVYRGLHNVPASKAGKLTGPSDPVRDKSWTTDIAVAAKFASTEWCSEDPAEGCVGVVLVADAAPDQLILDHEAIAELPGVFDQWDERWGETLESAIRDEREVLALGPLNVRTVKVVDMASLEDGGQSRLVQDAAARRYAPAVHTESRNVFETIRTDRAELGEVQQANGWRRYEILYSRSNNIQGYPGPGGSVIMEFRPEPVIRSPRSMNSGVGCPWELRHSPDLLTPDSVRGVALGAVITVEADDDGIHTSGMATAWGRDLFEAIDAPRDDPARARDVSVAYRVKVDPRPGMTDDGQHFDQRVVDLIWNSLASEPAGKAGTARVLTPRADATDGIWVSRADALLDIARGGATPSKPVYFDRSSWVRHDAHQPTRTTHEDAHHMELLTRLFKALGMAETDIAKILDIAEPEVAALLSGEAELTDEQMTLLVEAIVPRGGDAKPPQEGEPPPREDGDDLIAGLKALLAKAEERGDSETRRADKAEVLATKRKDAIETMIPRADADKMVVERGAQLGEAMELTHRSRGATFEPEPRKDAAEAPIPLGLEDWQRAAITGAFGDKAPEILSRIDAKSDPKIREDNLADRVQDAKAILAETGHTSRAVQDSIRRLRDDEATRRQNSNPEGGLAARKKAQRALAAGEPQAANGA